MSFQVGAFQIDAYQQVSVSPPAALQEIVPYLIGQTEDSARFMLTQVYLVPAVVGSGGTVTAQDVVAFTLVDRGTTVTITMGGPIHSPRGGRGTGQVPYNSGIH